MTTSRKLINGATDMREGYSPHPATLDVVLVQALRKTMVRICIAGEKPKYYDLVSLVRAHADSDFYGPHDKADKEEQFDYVHRWRRQVFKPHPEGHHASIAEMRKFVVSQVTEEVLDGE